MTLPKDFRECVELFVAHNVRFMVVGGHAVMAHGMPRFTDALDLWVEPSQENAERTLQALSAFGFGSLGLTADDIRSDDIIQLGDPPLRVDLLTILRGVTFAECYPDRIVVDVDGLDVPFIGREGLLAIKRASGRLKDRVDVEGLTGSDPGPPTNTP